MKENETNLSLLFSGGLDSVIAYQYALKGGYNPTAIYVDMGQSNAEKEKEAISKLPSSLKPELNVINMQELIPLLSSRLSNQIIPSRNVMLATIGSMFNSTVWLGVLDGEQNGKEHDKSPKFFRDTSSLLSFTNENFQDQTNITSPFLHMTKAETIGWALANNIKKEDLFETTSCYDSKESKCGKCLTCYKRYTSFLLNDIIEPGYETNPLESEYALELQREIPIAKANNDYSRFTRKRIEEYEEIQKKRKSLGL